MRAELLLLAALMLPGFGCGSSDLTGPSGVTLRISVVTHGTDLDDDGYQVVAGGSVTRVRANGAATFVLPPGSYEVRLEDLAPNCAQEGSNPMPVEIPSYVVEPREVTRAEMRVVCRSVSATIEVAALTTGRDSPVQGYEAEIAGPGGPRIQSMPHGTGAFNGLAAGTYTVTLDPVADNCALVGDASQTVSVTTGGLTRDTGRVIFSVACQAVTGDVELITRSSENPDGDGYLVALDGMPVMVESGYYYYYYPTPLRIGATASYRFERLTPGDHTIELTDIAPHCSVEGTNPRTVTVPVGVVVPVTFNVLCT